jgi:hypothetical protein
MASRRAKVRPRDANDTIDLSELAAGVAHAVLRAKVSLDEEALAIANQYSANPLFGALSPPAFAIGEARVTVKFAIARVESPAPTRRGAKRKPANVQVHVTATALAKIASHLVSEIEFCVTPELKRAQPTQQDVDDLE